MRNRIASVIWMVRGPPRRGLALGPSVRGVFAGEQGRFRSGLLLRVPFVGAHAEAAQELVAFETVFLSAWVRNRTRTPSRYLALILLVSICMGIVSQRSNVPVRRTSRSTLTP